MELKITKELLKSLYKNANYRLGLCFDNSENTFLFQELNIPKRDLVIVEKNVKLVFDKVDSRRYIFQICLILQHKLNDVGKYVYYENEKGVAIDDKLVFF
jgi:hypothetical protein